MPGNWKMTLYYQSGEAIMKGDKVLCAELPGEIEFVADPSIVDPATGWYVKEFGAGVMVSEPKVHGSVFASSPNENDELEFVARGN
jgi:hypothetical protein